MTSLADIMTKLLKYYYVGVSSVQPRHLITKVLSRRGETLSIGDRIYPLQNTYVVGFGKAVGDMVPAIESSFGSAIKEGIVSVPEGYMKFAASKNIGIHSSSKIRFYEGAKFNLPDDSARTTAERIVTLVTNLNQNDLLLVLVSGGGSALLPLPLSPLSLEEKTQIIKALSLRGASICELNTVRKALSATKGGKLIKNVKCQVVSFILSDIIDSPLDMIACGPTVPTHDSLQAPYEILAKYNIDVSSNVKSILNSRCLEKGSFDHVYNILIGDNNTALKSIAEYISPQQSDNECTSIIMTSCSQGEASVVGRELANFAFVILHYLANLNMNMSLESFCEKLRISESTLAILKNTLKNRTTSLCLLFGGETTVTVKGTGKGGRNQEMVLAFSIELEKLSKQYTIDGEIAFLSGGTDGIDGPTDAAGAVTYFSSKEGVTKLQTDEARKQNLDPEEFLQDNDSYEYFKRLSGAKYLLKPGHTGTNVMDIQLLYIRNIP